MRAVRLEGGACYLTPRLAPCSALFQSLEKPVLVLPFKSCYCLRSVPVLRWTSLALLAFPDSHFLSSGGNGRAGFDPSLATHCCLSDPSSSSPSRPSSFRLRTLIPLPQVGLLFNQNLHSLYNLSSGLFTPHHVLWEFTSSQYSKGSFSFSNLYF